MDPKNVNVSDLLLILIELVEMTFYRMIFYKNKTFYNMFQILSLSFANYVSNFAESFFLFRITRFKKDVFKTSILLLKQQWIWRLTWSGDAAKYQIKVRVICQMFYTNELQARASMFFFFLLS